MATNNDTLHSVRKKTIDPVDQCWMYPMKVQLLQEDLVVNFVECFCIIKIIYNYGVKIYNYGVKILMFNNASNTSSK